MGPQGGGRVRRAAGCDGACVTTWCWWRLEMMLLWLLFTLHLALQAQQPEAQQLEIVVLNTSVAREQKRPVVNRSFYSVSGHNLVIQCRYLIDSHDRTDYCALRNNTDLTVYPYGSNNRTHTLNSMRILSRTKCNLTVEFVNVTTEFEGPYRCDDLDNTGIFRQSTLKVGEVPVVPRNVSVVYQPTGRRRSYAKIILLFNPVKTRDDLNDPETKWKVEFDWRTSNQKCDRDHSDPRCKKLNEDGLCQACVILDKYDGCGQYTKVGNIVNDVNFSITVENKFGTALSTNTFFLPDWVQPDPAERIRRKRRGPSWLYVKVSPPKNYDQKHFNTLGSQNNSLALQYTVSFISGKEQSLLHRESKDFFDRHGLVRNLEEDEAALNQTFVSALLPYVSEVLLWNSSRTACNISIVHPEAAVVNVTDLPLPAYYYNLSVRVRAHYWSSPVIEQMQTHEASPVKGPQLHDNFAYCLPSTEPSTACLIYFKEIPRPWRGGVILNHTITLMLLNSIDLKGYSNCSTWEEMKVGGQNNTFLVSGLCVGGTYSVRLKAINKKGTSPVTSKTLHVRSSPVKGVPTNIVMEHGDTFYDLTWNPGSVSEEGKPTYYVHHCYTIPQVLQAAENVHGNESSKAPPLPLNCVTNMLAVKLTEDSTSSFTFGKVKTYTGLTPAFFISMVTPQGDGSGLLPVYCWYHKNTIPEYVDPQVRPVEDDPGALEVTAQLPCGSDMSYTFGRPERYAVGVVKGLCRADCSAVMRNSEPNIKEIKGNVKEQIKFTERGLDPGTSYCVGFKLIGRNDVRNSGWRCKTETTKLTDKSDSGVLVVTILAVLAAVGVVIFGTVWICRHFKEKEKLFAKSEEIVLVPDTEDLKKLTWSTDNQSCRSQCQPLLPGLQNGKVNPMFSMDSGLHSPSIGPTTLEFADETGRPRAANGGVLPGADREAEFPEQTDNTNHTNDSSTEEGRHDGEPYENGEESMDLTSQNVTGSRYAAGLQNGTNSRDAWISRQQSISTEETDEETEDEDEEETEEEEEGKEELDGEVENDSDEDDEETGVEGDEVVRSTNAETMEAGQPAVPPLLRDSAPRAGLLPLRPGPVSEPENLTACNQQPSLAENFSCNNILLAFDKLCEDSCDISEISPMLDIAGSTALSMGRENADLQTLPCTEMANSMADASSSTRGGAASAADGVNVAADLFTGEREAAGRRLLTEKSSSKLLSRGAVCEEEEMGNTKQDITQHKPDKKQQQQEDFTPSMETLSSSSSTSSDSGLGASQQKTSSTNSILKGFDDCDFKSELCPRADLIDQMDRTDETSSLSSGSQLRALQQKTSSMSSILKAFDDCDSKSELCPRADLTDQDRPAETVLIISNGESGIDSESAKESDAEMDCCKVSPVLQGHSHKCSPNSSHLRHPRTSVMAEHEKSPGRAAECIGNGKETVGSEGNLTTQVARGSHGVRIEEQADQKLQQNDITQSKFNPQPAPVVGTGHTSGETGLSLCAVGAQCPAEAKDSGQPCKSGMVRESTPVREITQTNSQNFALPLLEKQVPGSPDLSERSQLLSDRYWKVTQEEESKL